MRNLLGSAIVAMLPVVCGASGYCIGLAVMRKKCLRIVLEGLDAWKVQAYYKNAYSKAHFKPGEPDPFAVHRENFETQGRIDAAIILEEQIRNA